ncbi:hypothetical protein [uncultured Tenacibaculum sp.]|uniref:hypothetical protein n=1 Tax=uncultured Tenacibaculum sp. TaxID=174713 RepID=UPI00261DDF0B|nr:hypothetical protein [uncultured Tenacibaculum sp.]
MKNKFEKLGTILNKQAQHAITAGQDYNDLPDGSKTDPEICTRTVWGLTHVGMFPVPIRKIEGYEC